MSTQLDQEQASTIDGAKSRLLKEYRGKPVQRFQQFDCFINVEPGDCMVRPDPDGHSVFRSHTDELRNTGPELVRVTVHTDITREDALAALQKIVEKISRGFWGDDEDKLRMNLFSKGNLVAFTRPTEHVERGMVTDVIGNTVHVLFEDGSPGVFEGLGQKELRLIASDTLLNPEPESELPF